MGEPRQRGHETAGWNRDRLGFTSDLEGELALEDVERIRVLVVNVRAGDLLARWSIERRVIVTSSRATSMLISRFS